MTQTTEIGPWRCTIDCRGATLTHKAAGRRLAFWTAARARAYATVDPDEAAAVAWAVKRLDEMEDRQP